MKAQDPISNNNNFGEYSNTGQNVIINNKGGTSNNVIDGDFNFVGGTSNDLGGNNNLRNSFAYGVNNDVSAGSQEVSFALGEDITISQAPAIAIGAQTNISSSAVIAVGDQNRVTSSAGENILVGANIEISATDAIGYGSQLEISGTQAMAIGKGNTNNKLSNSINNSITIGTNAQNQLNLNPNGNVSIGTNNSPRNAPGSKLEIRGNGSSSSTSALNVKDNGGNSMLFVRDDEKVFVNSTSLLGGAPAGTNFQVDGSAYTNGTWAGSDIRMKKDTNIIKDPIEKIIQLDGYTYKYANNKFTKDRNLPKGRHSGIIAQQLDNVLPEAVKKGIGGLYAVNYDAIVPLLIETNKAQQKQIEKLEEKTEKVDQLQQKLQEQKAKYQELENRIKKLEKLVLENPKKEAEPSNNNDQKLQGNRLYQNSPNPFSRETTIKYRLSEKVNEAQIVVTNSHGNKLNRFDISGTGNGEVTIGGGTLKPGNYFYSLMVDGKRVASRKMVLIHK